MNIMKYFMSAFFVIIASYLNAAIMEDNCAQLNSPNDVILCIVEQHALTDVTKTKVQASHFGVEAAGQVPNPQLALQGLVSPGLSFGSIETALLHTFELGDKRQARIDRAKAIRSLSSGIDLKVKERLIVGAVVNMYRLRQIGTELDVLNENIKTFEAITLQYKGAGKLNPENAASLEVFLLILQKLHLKSVDLVNEKYALVTDIETGMGQKLNLTKSLLPKLKRSWPVIRKKKLAGSLIAPDRHYFDDK